MKRAFVLALLVVACVCAGTARADGDPASDYLIGQQVFLPFDAKAWLPLREEAKARQHAPSAPVFASDVAFRMVDFAPQPLAIVFRKGSQQPEQRVDELLAADHLAQALVERKVRVRQRDDNLA